MENPTTVLFFLPHFSGLTFKIAENELGWCKMFSLWVGQDILNYGFSVWAALLTLEELMSPSLDFTREEVPSPEGICLQ